MTDLFLDAAVLLGLGQLRLSVLQALSLPLGFRLLGQVAAHAERQGEPARPERSRRTRARSRSTDIR